MSRYIGQHFAQTEASTMPTYVMQPYRRSRAMIAAGVAAVALVAAGGFFAGRLTAPDETNAPATSTNGDKTAAPTADDLVTQGLALHQAGKLDEAAALYNQALAKDATNKFALFNLGQIAHTRQQYTAAIEKYKAVLAVDANYGPALYNVGLAYASSGDRTNAIASLRKANEVTPNNAPTLFNLGTMLVADGKTEEGNKFISQAVALDPSLKTKG